MTSTRPSGSIRTNGAAYLNRGLTHLFQRRYAEAIADFDQALRITPERPRARSARHRLPAGPSAGAGPGRCDDGPAPRPEERPGVQAARQRARARGHRDPGHRRLPQGARTGSVRRGDQEEPPGSRRNAVSRRSHHRPKARSAESRRIDSREARDPNQPPRWGPARRSPPEGRPRRSSSGRRRSR